MADKIAGAAHRTFVGAPADHDITEQELVRRSWDLDAAEKRYDELLARFDAHTFEPGDDLLFRASAPRPSPAPDAVRGPPTQVLLPDWPGVHAAKRLRDLRSEWDLPGTHAGLRSRGMQR